MASDDAVVAIDEDRVGEAKGPDAVGDLPQLLFGIGARVAPAAMGPIVVPYNEKIELISRLEVEPPLWTFRTTLAARRDFGDKTYREAGRPYWEYHQVPIERNRTPLSITFADIATHNHFVLDRGGKVFNRTAPVIKLPAKTSEADHLCPSKAPNSRAS